jgi:tetratricopeptide (TPR) repeat protein
MRVITAIMLAAFMSPSFGFNVSVTEADWATWPEYCRVAYTNTPIGQSKFGQLPKHTKDKWNAIVRPLGLHHFCVGMLFLNKARFAMDLNRQRGLYRAAMKEIGYSYNQIHSSNLNSPFHSLVHAYYSLALKGLGEETKAMEVLELGISGQPDAPESYIVKAQFERESGALDEAEATLLSVLERGKKNLAEAQYNLAHIYMLKEDFPSARKYARLAIDNGYPLQGIKNKLQRLGEWHRDTDIN